MDDNIKSFVSSSQVVHIITPYYIRILQQQDQSLPIPVPAPVQIKSQSGNSE